MVQGTNLQRIIRFVNPMQLYKTCEKSGGLHLVLQQAGRVAGWLAGWLANEILGEALILKACCELKYSIFHSI